MTVQGHTFVEGFCLHCGAMPPGTYNTCILRPVVIDHELRPEPVRRAYAVDDEDVISARLVELRKDREAIWNTIDQEAV